MPVAILTRVQYRLSKIYLGGADFITYNRVILFAADYEISNARFIEGFGAREFLVEGYKSTWQFRKQTSSPQMLYDFDIFRIIGNETSLPTVRSQLSITPAPMGLKVNEESDVFSCKLRDVDASHGEQVDTFNCEELGTNTDIEFYDRDVRSVGKQRNVLAERALISPTPAPEAVTELILDAL